MKFILAAFLVPLLSLAPVISTANRLTDTPPLAGAPPGSEEELDSLIGLVQSILARDEEVEWESLSPPPTRRARQAQIQRLSATFTRTLVDLGHLPKGRSARRFQEELVRRHRAIADRIEVLRERQKHFGPRARRYSAARHPAFSVNEYLAELAKAIAHLVVGLEKNQQDLKVREILSALSLRLLAEAYLSAGATRAAHKYIDRETLFMYAIAYLIVASLNQIATEDFTRAIVMGFSAVGPAIVFQKFPVWRANRRNDRKALKATGPLMEGFWNHLEEEIGALTGRPVNLKPQEIEERIWHSLLESGPPDTSAVPAKECEDLLLSLLKKGT